MESFFFSIENVLESYLHIISVVLTFFRKGDFFALRRDSKQEQLQGTKMNQGWHECDNNMMCFCPYQFNLLRIVNQLSTRAESITIEKKGIRLNLLVEPCMRNGATKDFRMKNETKQRKGTMRMMHIMIRKMMQPQNGKMHQGNK